MAIDTAKEIDASYSLPPAAAELLPLKAKSTFKRIYNAYVEYVGDGIKYRHSRIDNLKKRLQGLEKDYETYIRSDSSMFYRYYDKRFSPTERLKKQQEECRQEIERVAGEINEIKEAPDQIAKYLSWLEWYRDQELDYMLTEIVRLEGRKAKHFVKSIEEATVSSAPTIL